MARIGGRDWEIERLGGWMGKWDCEPGMLYGLFMTIFVECQREREGRLGMLAFDSCSLGMRNLFYDMRGEVECGVWCCGVVMQSDYSFFYCHRIPRGQ